MTIADAVWTWPSDSTTPFAGTCANRRPRIAARTLWIRNDVESGLAGLARFYDLWKQDALAQYRAILEAEFAEADDLSVTIDGPRLD